MKDIVIVKNKSNHLSAKQIRAAQLTAQGQSKVAIAKELAVSTETLRLWGKNPEFQFYLASLLHQSEEEFLQRLTAGKHKAAQVLLEMLGDEHPPAIRLRAAEDLAKLHDFPKLAREAETRIDDLGVEVWDEQANEGAKKFEAWLQNETFNQTFRQLLGAFIEDIDGEWGDQMWPDETEGVPTEEDPDLAFRRQKNMMIQLFRGFAAIDESPREVSHEAPANDQEDESSGSPRSS